MSTDKAEDSKARWINGSPSDELGSNRTAMAFDRTAMASDRTLMAILRTSLSLIGFGFTIFTFFHTLNSKYVRLPDGAPRRFGLSLITLGVLLLALGIWNHRKEATARRARRNRLVAQKLIVGVEPVKPSVTMVIAILLLMIGLFAMLSVGLNVGPFE
jgi:putative membrane protein